MRSGNRVAAPRLCDLVTFHIIERRPTTWTSVGSDMRQKSVGSNRQVVGSKLPPRRIDFGRRGRARLGHPRAVRPPAAARRKASPPSVCSETGRAAVISFDTAPICGSARVFMLALGDGARLERGRSPTHFEDGFHEAGLRVMMAARRVFAAPPESCRFGKRWL